MQLRSGERCPVRLSHTALFPAAWSELTQLPHVTAGLEPRHSDPWGVGERLCSGPWHHWCFGKILSGLAFISKSAVPDPGVATVGILKGEKRKRRCNNRKYGCVFCKTNCGNKTHPVCEGSQPPHWDSWSHCDLRWKGSTSTALCG